MWFVFLSIFCLCGTGKRRFRVSTPSELDKFGFLVDGDDIHISVKTEVSRIGVNVNLTLDDLAVRTAMTTILQTIERWEAYPPFAQDRELRLEYISMGSNGLTYTRKMIENTKILLSYISPSTPYISTHSCVVPVRTLSTDKFTRAQYNLQKRWSHIDATWTPQTIKNDKSQANTLLLFANYLNDMGVSLYQETAEILQILEQLSDNQFPTEIKADLENSACIHEDAGENYKVKNCEKTVLGLCCDLEAVIPKQLETFTQLYPVHYANIRLKLCDHCFYVKNKDSGSVKYANCSARLSMNMDFPVCNFSPLEKDCLKYLEELDIEKSIQNCRFDLSTPELSITVPKQGIFIQGNDDISVSSGTKLISNNPPFIVYSPDPVVIKNSELEITIPGGSNITSLQIAESILTEDDIKALKRHHFWDEFKHEWGTDDTFRVTLLSLQILFVPFSVGLSVFLFFKNKATLKVLTAGKTRAEAKTNFEENRKMLKTSRRK